MTSLRTQVTPDDGELTGFTTFHEWHCQEPLALECGGQLESFTLRYTTAGYLAPDGSNVIWVLHPLTCTSDFAAWWEGMLGPGKALDPSRHFIICANTIGSCHGSTGPSSLWTDGSPARLRFPPLTMRDVVIALDRLRRHLGIYRIALGIGGSYGGQQLFEWLAREPTIFEHACIIGASDRQSPWAVAFNEAQRMALEADASFGGEGLNAGRAGLAAARAVAVLSYRSASLYAKTQTDAVAHAFDFRAAAYQRSMGERFAMTFDPHSYWALTRIMDSHNIYRGRGVPEDTLRPISSRCLLIALEGDVLFPAEDVFRPATWLTDATCIELPCDHGHDSILTHASEISDCVLAFASAPSNWRKQPAPLGCES